MDYNTIQPPFTLKFEEMLKEELEAYGTWFHQIMPDRIAELSKAVKSTPGFESWEPNYSPESLDVLGQWLEGQVKTRRRTEEEMREIKSRLTFPIDIPDKELTNQSFSLAIDIGMYFAQVVLKNVPGTQWDQPLKNKRFADYGQPVVIGFGPVTLNPVGVVLTTAYGISRNKPARLQELYETWVRMKKP